MYVPWLLAGVVHIAWTLPLPSLAAPPSPLLGEHESPDQPNREEHNTLNVTRGLTSKGHFQLSWLGSQSCEANPLLVHLTVSITYPHTQKTHNVLHFQLSWLGLYSCTSNSLYYLPSHTQKTHIVLYCTYLDCFEVLLQFGLPAALPVNFLTLSRDLFSKLYTQEIWIKNFFPTVLLMLAICQT